MYTSEQFRGKDLAQGSNSGILAVLQFWTHNL